MQDYVAFAGYNVSSQAFALVESVSRDLLGGDISGLMGEFRSPPSFLLTCEHGSWCALTTSTPRCRPRLATPRGVSSRPVVAKPLPRERAPLSRLCRLVIAVHQRPERVVDRTRRVPHLRVPQLVPLQQRDQLCPLAEWARELLARQDGSGRRQWDECHFVGALDGGDERAGGYGRDRYGDDLDRRAEGRRRQHLRARARRESRDGRLHRSVARSFFLFPVESLLTRRDAALHRLLLVPVFGQRHGRSHLWRSRTFLFPFLFPQGPIPRTRVPN